MKHYVQAVLATETSQRTVDGRSDWGTVHVPRSRENAAFTLIELLVVVSIIALLISLLLPAMAQAQKEVQALMCANNQRNWGQAYAVYYENNDSAIPYFANQYPGPTAGTAWYQVPAPYMGVVVDMTNAAEREAWSESDLIKCPADSLRYPVRLGAVYGGVRAYESAGSSRLIKPGAPLLYGRKAGNPYPPPLRIEDINQPATWAMIVDSENGLMYSFNHWVPTFDADGDGRADTAQNVWDAHKALYNHALPKIHSGTSNVLMVDGHVERMVFHDFIDPDADMWHD